METKEKQEEQEPKQEKKLELKDCVARESGWDFTLGILGCYAAGALALAAVFALFLVVFQMLIGAVPLTNGAIRVIVFLAFGAWLIGFTLIAIIWRKPLMEYWQRNVVGYTMHLFYGKDGESIEYFIYYGRTDLAGEGGTLFDLYLYVPLGGWFRRPFIKHLDYDYESDERYWRLKMAVPCHNLSMERRLYFYLYDSYDSRLWASAEEILDIVKNNRSMPILDMLINQGIDLKSANRQLKEVKTRFDQVVFAAMMAVEAITETSRFGHSTEGAEIRQKLTKAVIDALPAGDARIKPLQAALKAKVGRRQKAKIS